MLASQLSSLKRWQALLSCLRAGTRTREHSHSQVWLWLWLAETIKTRSICRHRLVHGMLCKLGIHFRQALA